MVYILLNSRIKNIKSISNMNEEDKLFIIENINADTSKLLFKFHKDTNKRFLINQIGKRQKTKSKLPSLFENYNFTFPQNSKAIEQCSSEKSAEAKSNYFKGNNFLDLTGGLGIDTLFFSRNFENIYYNEKNITLYDLAKLNYPTFNLSNLSAADFIENNNTEFDLVYIDPDRRDDSNRKLYKLEDLQPNILEIILKLKSKEFLIKLSPIYEIKELDKYFDNYDVWLISIDNELKELLVHIKADAVRKIKLLIIKDGNINEFNYDFSDTKLDLENNIANYLYEPDVAVLKANLQDQIGKEFNLNKLNMNTHFYFSDVLNNEYPGNIYKVKSKLHYNKKEFKTQGIDSGIIKIRNFDDTLSNIKKKLSIKENNKQYLFFMKDYHDKNICVVCDKIIN